MEKFPRVRIKGGAAIAVAGSIVFFLGRVFGGESSELEATANQSKNLARLNCGAHIDRILSDGRSFALQVGGDRSSDPSALILDDNNLGTSLPPGTSTFIITLPRIAGLQRFSFINQNAAGQGEFELAVSNSRLRPNDRQWRVVQSSQSFAGQRLLNLSLLGIEAKYVKISFHMQKEGRLAGVALYGNPTLANFASRHVLQARTSYSFASLKSVTHPEDTLNFNFANGYARARVVYVSSGSLSQAARMIDDDLSTSYSFAASDARPTVIIALADRQKLHRVSAIYQMQRGQLEVFLLDELGAIPGDLASARLVTTLSDQESDGKAAADFDPRGARYVALRWTPKKPETRSIDVAEIGVFGAATLTVLDLEAVPNAFAQTFMPGEGSHDFSNGLGTLANPPTLAPVSP